RLHHSAADRDQAAPGVARAGDRVRQRAKLPLSLRIPARLLAVGRGARPWARPGGAADRQARRHDLDRRGSWPLRAAAELLRRPRHRHLFVGLPLRARRRAGRAVATLPRPDGEGRREPGRIGGRTRKSGARIQASGSSRPGTPPSILAPEMTDPTHFGYEQVSPDEKTRRVRGVFDSVANRYDLMNDLMSAGLHRA